MRHHAWVKKSRTWAFLFLFPLIASGATLDITGGVQAYASLTNTTVNMSGQSELHITGKIDPMLGCTINLNSSEAWFFMEQILPSVISSTYLSQIKVNGATAAVGTNVRIVQYASGAVVIPHSSSYQPLQVYSGYFYAGTSQSMSLYTYYKTASLGALNNAISSFKLKRGYMATFAQNENGTGIGRTYVAQDGDVNIAVLPGELDNSISFIRVFPWRWDHKKGLSGGDSAILSALNCSWWYNWNNDQDSTLNIEYIPIRQNSTWPSYSSFNSKQDCTAVLGFNEPDQTNQANMTVAAALDQWPNIMASGLRVGSPAPSDGGLSWLYDFIDQADARNYRVDYVAVHYYKGGWTASQLYTWLKGIHDRTRRPLWVTEWNNGANWTCCDPASPAANAVIIDSFMDVMNAAPFVERYAVYNWLTDNRLLWTSTSPVTLTAAGEAYRDNVAPIAYTQSPPEGSGGCAYYQFENNTQDSLFYGNHGVAKGGPAYVAGHGLAIDLDGTDDYVMLPENIGDCKDFTFAAWVNWDGSSQNQRIFDFGNGTTYNMFLTPRSGSNTLRFAITTTSYTGEQALSTTQMVTGTWVHVAVTISGNTGKLFVNGALVNTNTNMTINPSDLKTKENYLGKSQYDDPYFNGRLEDVRIADYALTDAQISALAVNSTANLPPVFTANPINKPAVKYRKIYNDSLVYSAGDADAGVMPTFSKIGGPAWLGVSADGTLSGTPSISDAGLNSFQVRVTDSAGAYSEAALNIKVYGDELISLYKLDGNTNDSVGVNHGTAAGSPVYTTGKSGQAITLDAVDDYVTLPPGVANFDDITVALWVYWDGGGQWQRIFDFGTGTTEYMFLTPLSGGNTLRFTIKNGGSEQIVQTAGQLASGQWVHLAVTLSGNTATLYVNGAAAAAGSSITINPSDFNPGINYIGKSQFSADPLFDGLIDDFRIYNYALSAAEVTQVYSPTLPVSPSPADGAVGVTAQVLSWLPGTYGETAWQVYFGTNLTSVTNATPASAEYKGVRYEPKLTPPVLSSGTTYYWRVDPLLPNGVVPKNSAWRFTTGTWSLTPVGPKFTSYIITRPDAVEGIAYSQSLSDTMLYTGTYTFQILGGPEWMDISSDGQLTGTPPEGSAGQNDFTVRVSNASGVSDEARITITVKNTYSGRRGINDFLAFAQEWLYEGAAFNPADLDQNGRADMSDFQLFAAQWLAELEPGLVAEWDFSNADGQTVFDLAGFHNGTTQNMNTSWRPLETIAGQTNHCLLLDGVDDYVEITGYKGITGTASRTCMAWIKTSGSSVVNTVILDWGATAAGQKWLFGIFTTGKLAIYTWPPYIQTNITVTDNQWHHVAAVLVDDGTPDVSEIKLYVDGLPQATTASSAQAINTIPAANVLIGAFDSAGTKAGYFNGLIDDVRIYNRPLTDAEIAILSQ